MLNKDPTHGYPSILRYCHPHFNMAFSSVDAKAQPCTLTALFTSIPLQRQLTCPSAAIAQATKICEATTYDNIISISKLELELGDLQDFLRAQRNRYRTLLDHIQVSRFRYDTDAVYQISKDCESRLQAIQQSLNSTIEQVSQLDEIMADGSLAGVLFEKVL